MRGLALAALLPGAAACGRDGCYGPVTSVQHVRHVKRMQPGALDAPYGPRRPLEWGQINFLHTTDTHGWLEGHLKEKNYGADWGDFVTFAHRMKQTAADLGVDLLLVDTGDLHDGTGLSDATAVDGAASMGIFQELEYDLLTIGNHELYVSEVAYQMFNHYARRWGDRYVTSNVQVLNRTTGEFEYVGATHRYFTTREGLRIMAFGVLFDFTGNSNASRVLRAADMVKQAWFTDALATRDPVDLFVLFGHNPVRPTNAQSTFRAVLDAIRAAHPATPVQIFGGHSHVRDFAVLDDAAVALESGRYCETLGWASVAGFNESNSGYGAAAGKKPPRGVGWARRPARPGSASPLVYARRYLDWNRKTFVYHARERDDSFDQDAGRLVTAQIADARRQLRLGDVYGCAPQSWCAHCVPFDDETRNIFPGVIYPAAAEVVVNRSRADRPRIVLGNTGGIRFDLHKGPFTYDDSFIVSPFRNVFLYVPDVPMDRASGLLQQLNRGPADKRHVAPAAGLGDDCADPALGYVGRRDAHPARGHVRRQEAVTPGYVTVDDWGDDGDDTEHSMIPSLAIPGYWGVRAAFPADGSRPDRVDVVFVDYIKSHVLENLGAGYTDAMVHCYVDCNFTSQDFLLPYAARAWRANKDNCPVA